MKPFTLDTVLQYRERLENLAQEALSKARREEDRVKQALDHQTDSYERLKQDIDRIQQEGVNILELIGKEEHLAYSREGIKALQAELSKKQEGVKKAHSLLVEKSRDRQVMEKLKEKQNTAWMQYLNKKEAAILDEMAIMFHDRK